MRTFLLATYLAMVVAAPPRARADTGPSNPGGEYARHFGYVVMKDGVRLAYVVYLPKAKGRFPAVLQYEPYQGAGSNPGWPASTWLQNGYAVIFASVRGTGCSQGVLDLFGPHEGPSEPVCGSMAMQPCRMPERH